VKRRQLLRELRSLAAQAGVELVALRNAGGHEVLALGGHRIVVPNHREIAEGTAASILRQAERVLEEER
jgi:predicted RNA binding protein YcfA (HicA-like mRNA interferase family)